MPGTASYISRIDATANACSLWEPYFFLLYMHIDIVHGEPVKCDLAAFEMALG